MMTAFFRSDRGFALVLTLIFLPVFIGVGLLVIDIGRGNGAQSDHQAAADALALAGARELDGLPDARLRAMQAMERIVNEVNFLGLSGADLRIDLDYTAGGTDPFTVIFLKAIPATDDAPIDQAWVSANSAATDAEAGYVYVFSRARDLRTFFFNPVTRANQNVPIGATAVATLKTVTCDLVPLFICNPFATKDAFVAAYEAGDLHGRMLKLRDVPGAGQASAQAATPGNIGFLSVTENGAKALAVALAGVPYPQCIELDDQVTTRPGAVNSAWEGFNTRFDVYAISGPPTGSPPAVDDFRKTGAYGPARNVRKGWGYRTTGGGAANACNRVPVTDINSIRTAAQVTDFYRRFPRMSDNVDLDPVFGDFIRAGDWNLNRDVTIDLPNDGIDGPVTFPAYWNSLYGQTLGETEMAGISSRAGLHPSRYDVYRWEIANDLLDTRSQGTTATNGERGANQCYSGPTSAQTLIDRRTMLVAVVDCGIPGGVKGRMDIAFDLLAKVFLVNPGGTVPGNDSTLDIEIVGLSENRSTGEIDEFLKNEVLLVR